jgi:hypothetical protein
MKSRLMQVRAAAKVTRVVLRFQEDAWSFPRLPWLDRIAARGEEGRCILIETCGGHATKVVEHGGGTCYLPGEATYVQHGRGRATTSHRLFETQMLEGIGLRRACRSATRATSGKDRGNSFAAIPMLIRHRDSRMSVLQSSVVPAEFDERLSGSQWPRPQSFPVASARF